MELFEPVITGSLTITGSLLVSGSISSTGGITISGSITSASFATTSSYSVSSSYALSGSYSLTATTASNSLTASSADNFVVRQNVTASNMLATGRITAQTLVVQTVTSSIVYSSGSNIFGNQLTDVQQFTGSLRVTGSVTYASFLTVYKDGSNSIGAGPYHQVANTAGTNAIAWQLNASNGYDFWTYNGSAWCNKITLTQGGCIGVGTCTPNYDIHVNNPSIPRIQLTNTATGTTTGDGLHIYQSGGDSYLINKEACSLLLGTNNVVDMTITGSRVGIGTSTPTEKLDLQGTMNMNGPSGTYLQVQYNGANKGYFGTANGVIASGCICDFGISAVANLVFGTAGTLTERMRITSGGNVLIGTTGSYAALNVNGNAQFGSPTLKTTGTEYIIVGQNSSTGPDDGNSSGIYVNHAVASASPNVKFTYQFRQNDNSGANLYGDLIRATKEAGSNSTYTTFYTNSTTGAGTERMRINSGGFLRASNTGTYNSTTGLYHELRTDQDNWTLYMTSTCTTLTSPILRIRGSRTSVGGSYYHIYADNGNATGTFAVYDSGNAANTNGSFGVFSDISLKENIVDATPKLDDVLKLKVRNFNLKVNPEFKHIGFIAQELEEVFPALIDVDGNTGNKLIKSTVLIPILVKAIQEQQCKIKILESCLGIN